MRGAQALAGTLLLALLGATPALTQAVAPQPPANPTSMAQCEQFSAAYRAYLSGLLAASSACQSALSVPEVTDQVPVRCSYFPTASRRCVPQIEAHLCASEGFHTLLAQCRAAVNAAQQAARADSGGDYRDEIIRVYRDKAAGTDDNTLLPAPLKEIRDRLEQVNTMVGAVSNPKDPRAVLNLGITAAQEVYGYTSSGGLQQYLFDSAVEAVGTVGATAIEDAERALRAFDDAYEAEDGVSGASIAALQSPAAPQKKGDGGGQSKARMCSSPIGNVPERWSYCGTTDAMYTCFCNGGSCSLHFRGNVCGVVNHIWDFY